LYAGGKKEGSHMATRTDIKPAKLANGSTIYIEVTSLGGEVDVARSIPSFEGVTEAIEGIAGTLKESLDRVKPRKASLEFGLEVAMESGQLTALLVKGSGTAHLTITLEWGEG
jgi:hypothetical protein